MQHVCINYRFPISGGLYVWEFEENGREIKVRVDGQLVFNNIFHVLDAAVAGWKGGRPIGKATTSTIRAAGNRHRPSSLYWRHCVTATDIALHRRPIRPK